MVYIPTTALIFRYNDIHCVVNLIHVSAIFMEMFNKERYVYVVTSH